MRVLFVHPGPLLYTKVFLRLEPLGLEVVAEAVRKAGHAVRLIDLQVEAHKDYHAIVADWQPNLIAFSCNYLANVPEIVELAKATKAALPHSTICVGGHSASFTAYALLEHGQGAVDCVLKGEGEASIAKLLEAVEQDRRALTCVPGIVTSHGEGPAPSFVHSLDEIRPARDLLRHRRKYFIGLLDPCASVEFSRGCPWDCSFCSAWTFYGRSYRLVSPDRAVDEISSIAEPGVFIVDDVAFIHSRHGFAIGEGIARRGIRKRYYLETRGDVLLKNKEVFQFWKKIGLRYIFLGLEAIDEEGLQKFRKRVPLGRNFEALELARSLGIKVAINLIADPDWDEERFATVRHWCMEIPEIVNITVNTPYPGTESWLTEERRIQTRDYRLFDIQHAVLPTRLPLDVFYRELLSIQKVLFRKRLDWRSTLSYARETAECMLRGQTNYLRGMILFKKTYTLERLLGDHSGPVQYAIPPQPTLTNRPANGAAMAMQLYVHTPQKKAARHLDSVTGRFVATSRI
jgi:hopanoid C-3 methylase HpnR